MSKNIITIFGSTGNQGGAVVRMFLNDPKLKSQWAVRGVTRDVAMSSSRPVPAAATLDPRPRTRSSRTPRPAVANPRISA